MIETMIANVIRREGGYVDHPNDNGGATNFGITISTLTDHRGVICSDRDVRLLQYTEAETIYRLNYWLAPGFDRLNVHAVLMDCLFDAAVNHGPTRAIKLLQACIGVKVDGLLGPISCESVSRMADANMLALFVAERIEFYGKIVKKNPTQSVFIHGWLRRMSGFIQDIPLVT